MQDEYLTRCVVDPVSRKFFLYSNEGEERVVDCDTVDQFMAVLEICRDNLDEDTLAYANPLWAKLALASIFGGKKIRQKFCPYYFFMNHYWWSYDPNLYKEILECYNYETRNPTIYGNVIRGEMEFTKSSKKCGSDQQGDENHL